MCQCIAELPRVLTVSAAAAVGITTAQLRTELRRGRWRRMAPGILLTRPELPTRADWVVAGLALVRGRGAVSGWDALRTRGLGGHEPPSPTVLILTSSGGNRRVGGAHIRPSRRPLRTVRTAACDEMPFIEIVDVARAIADTARDHQSLSPVRALVTSAIQRGLCTVDDLVGELNSGPRNGSAFLRHALNDVCDRARSVAEAQAVDRLRPADVPPFELNVPIVDSAGRTIAIADVLWRRLRAILEIDSREFHFAESDWKATMRRHNRLTRAGLAVSHYAPAEIRDRGVAWAAEVAQWLRARARELGIGYQGASREAAVIRSAAPDPFLLTF